MTEIPAGAPEEFRVRQAKADRMRERGLDPYPVSYPVTASAAALRERHQGLAPDVATGETVAVAGRVMLSRVGGGLCFATLRDGTGELQVMISRDSAGPDALADWKALVDRGDHVGVTGEVVTSRRGELSVLASSWALTAKALRPLPEKYRGLTDPQARVRRRYVDLIMRDESRQMMRWRVEATWSLRSVLREQGFLEVETPMLQLVHGGANARPFVTHCNALDTELYLRIAPELFLKRLVVGGADKVFELNRDFRNEGIDSTHSAEFTMLEAYQAYGDYDSMAVSVQSWVQRVAADLEPLGARAPVELSGPWRAATLHELVSDALGEAITPDTDVAQLRRHAERAGVALEAHWGPGAVVLELYEKLVEHTLVEPTFVRDFPVEVSPLTRAHRGDPRLAEKWDLVIGGVEIATAYSELVDPVEQRARLVAQSLLAAGGDPDAMVLDEDFLYALEIGMPPTGGMGMGTDRLLRAVTGAGSIRDTMLFPLVRPE